MSDDTKKQVLAFLKGLLAVIVVNACVAALNYIGSHIPGAIQYLAGTVVAAKTIHASTT